MNYYVNSAIRLRLFFDQPNHLAIALVMVWGVFVYLLSFTRKRESGDAGIMTYSEIVRFSFLLALILASMVSLSATYSRSGMVAFLVVACVLWRSRDARHWIVMSFIVLAFCIALMPEAGGRFTSIEPFADKSISHRFDVWRGTLAMSLEKPWTGFGAYNFGETLTTWHLPVDGSNARYVTAVNAPLTFLGYWGYPALFGYLFVWILLLIAGFRGWWHSSKAQIQTVNNEPPLQGLGSFITPKPRALPWAVMNRAVGPLIPRDSQQFRLRAITACFIVQIAFLVGGFFTHLHQSRILHLVLLASICGTIIFHRNDEQAWRLFPRRWLPIAAISSAVLCVVLAGAGFWLFSEGYTLRGFPLDAQGKSTGHGWVLVPDKPTGNRLVWFIPHGAVREHAQMLCRPLAKQGWEVVMLEAGVGEILKPEVVLHSSMGFQERCSPEQQAGLVPGAPGRLGSLRYVVGGIGEEGLAALALASRVGREKDGARETVVVNIESYWPFAEFNPQNTIKTTGGPVVLAYVNADTHYAQAANQLAGMGGKTGRQITLQPLDVSGGNNILSALRVNYFCSPTNQTNQHQPTK